MKIEVCCPTDIVCEDSEERVVGFLEYVGTYKHIDSPDGDPDCWTEWTATWPIITVYSS